MRRLRLTSCKPFTPSMTPTPMDVRAQRRRPASVNFTIRRRRRTLADGGGRSATNPLFVGSARLATSCGHRKWARGLLASSGHDSGQM